MALTINRPGVEPYSNKLLKHLDDPGRSEFGHAQGKGRSGDKGQSEGAVRLSISDEALSMFNSRKAATDAFEDLSAEDRERMIALTGELDEVVGNAGGFRRLTETQWERVEEIFGEISDIYGLEEDEQPRIDDLRRIYELEDELDALYGDDPEKTLSSAEEERVDQIMAELDELWGVPGGEIALTEEEERQLEILETQLEGMAVKVDDWSLTPEDEDQVNSLFSAMDKIFENAEQRILAQEEQRTVEGV